MALSDLVADFLTRIRNALDAQHRFLDVDWSKMKERLAEILKEEGFIETFLVRKEESRGTIRIFLKYAENRESVIQGLKRISKPGRRRYVNYKNIRPVFGGMGIVIVSTSQGVMVGREARDKKIGGEILCSVW